MTAALLLACAAPAVAVELDGTVGIEGTSVDYDSDNRYKATEYRDQERGVRGSLELSLRQGDYSLALTGENFGYNNASDSGYRDERFTLTAGRIDMFRLSLLYDETPHNLTYGALVPYSGFNSSPIIFTGVAVPFDYRLDRKTYAAGFEGNFGTPFFFSLKADRQKRDGNYPIGTGEGFVPFELPAPVESTTDTYSLQAGYHSDRFSLVLDGAVGTFDTDDQYLDFLEPIVFNGVVPITQASDSDFYKIGGSLRLKLPAATILSGRVSHSVVTSDLAVPDDVNGPRSPFDGDVGTTSVDVSVSSAPVRSLDLKAFYSYLEMEDDSSLRAANVVVAEAADRYSFDRNRAGVEVGWRLPFSTKVRAGAEMVQTDRSSRRYGADTDDVIVFAEVKNSSLEFMTARLRYQYLDRDGSMDSGIGFNAATDVFPYDIADKTQHAVKASLELQPLEKLNIGLEYQLRQSDFDSELGVSKDTRHQVYADASYEVSIVRIAGRVGWEQVERDLDSRSAGGYDWRSSREDTNKFYGLSTTLDIIKDRLKAELSWDYDTTDGSADFRTNPLQPTVIDLGAVDDYSRRRLSAILTCNVTRAMTLRGGYMHDRLTYSDNGWNSVSTSPLVVAGDHVLTGAYVDPDYRAHIGFLQLSYAF
jgi:MtrB/PioB family decaheme-associated outer membrane protein